VPAAAGQVDRQDAQFRFRRANSATTKSQQSPACAPPWTRTRPGSSIFASPLDFVDGAIGGPSPNHPQRRNRPWIAKHTSGDSKIRSAVLGEEYVNKALADADDFTGPLQDLLTEVLLGRGVWGRDGLTRKTRSMLNLAMTSVLNRPPHELRTHVKGGALTNGVTREEIREIFLQVAIYAGAPAAVDSFRTAGEVFAELDQS